MDPLVKMQYWHIRFESNNIFSFLTRPNHKNFKKSSKYSQMSFTRDFSLSTFTRESGRLQKSERDNPEVCDLYMCKMFTNSKVWIFVMERRISQQNVTEKYVNGNSFEPGGISHHRVSRKTSCMEDCDVCCKVCKFIVCGVVSDSIYLSGY